MTTRRRIAIGLAALLAAAVVAAGLLLWRIAQAPMPLAPVAALLDRAVADAWPGAHLDAARSSVRWQRLQGEVELLLDGVVLRGGPLAAPISAKRVRLGLDAGALALARLKLRRVDLNGLDLSVDWCLKACQPTDVMSYEQGRALITALIGAALAQEELSDFIALRVTGGGLIRLRETASGVVHVLDIDDVSITRAGDALTLSANGRLTRADEAVGAVRLEGRLDAAGQGDAQLGFDSASVAALAAGLPLDGWASAIAMPLALEAGLTITQTADADRLDLQLKAGPGDVVHPDFYPAARHFDSIVAQVAYQPAARALAVDSFAARFGGAVFEAGGRGAFGTSSPAVAMRGILRAVSVATLKAYWPSRVGEGGRDWVVENIDQGQITEARLNINIQPEDWAPGAMPQSALTLDFDMRGITAHYRRPMPPIENAVGVGHLSLDDLRIDVASGMVNGLTLQPSAILIAPFNTAPSYGDIVFALEGPLPRLLEIADSEPLGYIGVYGLSPNDAAGMATARATMRLPLLKEVPMEDVVFDGAFAAQSFAMPDLLPFGGISDGVLNLAVTMEELTAEGTMRLAGVPAQLAWREAFTDDDALPTTLALNATVSPADLVRFGIDPAPRFEGLAYVEILAQGRGTEISQGQIDLELRDAALREPLLGWRKALGAPASAKGAFRVMDGAIRVIDAHLAGEGLEAAFGLRLDLTSDKVSLDFDTLSLGETAMAGSVILDRDRWHVLLNGARLDLRPAIEWLYQPRQAPEAAALLPDMAASITIDEVLLAHDEILTGMVAGIETQGNRWRDVTFAGQLGAEGAVSLRIESDGDKRQLTLRADDAGRVARALDLFSQGEGGDLELIADLTGDNAAIAMQGRATMHDFRLRQAPVLARILSVGSLTGIANLARDGGIQFREFDVPFSLHDGIIDIDDASANGPALGLTMSGQFVRSLERANLKGVIVPAYTLNSFLGKIPLLGDILTGGENEGLFAINYQVEGNLTDPEISVNPMSMLTPGILRRILRGSRGTVEADPAIEAPLETAPAETETEPETESAP